MSAPAFVRAGEPTAIDACDRCLALSRLTPLLCSVPVLRGTPEHEALMRAKAGAAGESGEADPSRAARSAAVCRRA